MQQQTKSNTEFIVIMASLMSISALSIDALLPGLNQIGASLNILDSKDKQLLISMIFLGLGSGQLISGPLSDSLGRKPVIYIGFVVFALASLLCVFSTNLETMVLGRLLQGVGLSAPKTVSMAMIRDRFSGNYMARIMSFITVIFILVPVVAPSFGKLMLDHFGWQSIFYSQLLFGLLVTIWLWKRQEETLKPEDKKAVKLTLFAEGVREFVKHKNSVVFTIFSGFITAAFLVYLSSSQQIFQEQYHLINEFPFIFSGLAIGIGIATYFNGRFVVRLGMMKMVRVSTIAVTLISLLYIVLFSGHANPSIYVLVLFLALLFFSIGFIFGNINALAMQPLGHIAGIGAAILGFVSTAMAVPLATYLGRYITTTALPIFVGFAIAGVLSLLLIQYIRISEKNILNEQEVHLNAQAILLDEKVK